MAEVDDQAPEGRRSFLREMVRQAERAIDRQIQAFDRADRRSEQMLGVGVAATAAGIAIMRGVQEPGASAAAEIMMLALAFLWNATAVMRFLRSYLRLREHEGIRAGPSPEWIAARSREATLSEPAYLVRVLHIMADEYFENLLRLDWAVRERDRGVRALLAAAVLYAAAISYTTVISVFG